MFVIVMFVCMVSHKVVFVNVMLACGISHEVVFVNVMFVCKVLRKSCVSVVFVCV